MIIIRRRLIFWLIKAYIKKWSRLILAFFFLGLIAFFALRVTIQILPSAFSFLQKETIGMTGSYTINNLPSTIFYKLSYGLTSVSQDGSIKPGAATSWKIDGSGKIYTFFLKRDIQFADGIPLTSRYINYGFSDVSVTKPDDYTIIFKLKDNYAPFLATVSRPIFKKKFIGLGSYRIKYIKLNGEFVVEIELAPINPQAAVLRYHFFPTEDAVKTAFVLGEVSRIYGIHDLNFKDTSIEKFKNIKLEKTLNNNQLVTLFFNTKDQVLSEKKVREALSYAIPDTFSGGTRNFGPYPPNFWVTYDRADFRFEDLSHARNILSQSQSASSSSNIHFTLKTLPQYKDTAQAISQNFKKINVYTKIEVVDSIPSTFQFFLGDFSPSKDPDQYMLWHSSQSNNITGYSNLRIDKLLEDGRKTIDRNERKKIYADFQKYFFDDPPAIFLYSPYIYDVARN